MRLRFAGHINSVDAAAVEQIEFGIRTVATIAEGKATTAFLRECLTRQFTMAAWHHETIFVISNRQVTLHFLCLRFA